MAGANKSATTSARRSKRKNGIGPNAIIARTRFPIPASGRHRLCGDRFVPAPDCVPHRASPLPPLMHYALLRPLLFALEPERAHGLTLDALDRTHALGLIALVAPRAAGTAVR